MPLTVHDLWDQPAKAANSVYFHRQRFPGGSGKNSVIPAARAAGKIALYLRHNRAKSIILLRHYFANHGTKNFMKGPTILALHLLYALK